MIHNRQTKTLEIQDSIAKTDKHFTDYHTKEQIYVGENIYICLGPVECRHRCGDEIVVVAKFWG
jgi:hypothetical protein